MKTAKVLEDVAIEIVNILAKHDLSYYDGMIALDHAKRIVEYHAKIRKIEND